MSALRENTNGFLDDDFEEELEQQMFGLDLDDDNDEEENHNHNYNDITSIRSTQSAWHMKKLRIFRYSVLFVYVTYY